MEENSEWRRGRLRAFPRCLQPTIRRWVLFWSTGLLTSVAFAQPYTGSLAGTVRDSKTDEPLPGVNIVVVELEGRGTATDAQGLFTLTGLPVGTYSLRFSAVGYQRRILTNIVVSTGRVTPVHARLEEAVIEMSEVTVRASYFSKAQQLSPLSTNALDRSEIRRSPGGVQDVQRVVQSLPGVASSTDNINELIVRGGAPFENLTVLDQMEIPSINHYSNQFNSAGPINMVNADMIQDVQFSAGGFPVQYGDKSASVMNIAVREGTRSVPFSSMTFFNFAGAGALLEGGFGRGRGSYIVSVRKSSLEVLDQIVGLSAISLVAIPRYWDTQAKVVYDLSAADKLSLNILYGESRITIEGDPEETNPKLANSIDSSSVQRAYPFNRQSVYGLSWKRLWGKDGYSTLTVYGAGSAYRVQTFSDFTRRVFGPEGKVMSHVVLNSHPEFINDSEESYLAAKYELYYQPLRAHELSVGAQAQTSRRWKNYYWLAGDTARFDLDRDGVFETGPVASRQGSFDQTIGLGEQTKYFVYASDRWRVLERLWLTIGARYDHFTYSGRGGFSPRFSLSWQVIPHTTTVTIAAGRYPQSQPFPYYSDRRRMGYNRTLPHMMSDHVVAGVEHILDAGAKLSLETYFKNYSRIGVSEDFIYSSVETFWSDRVLAVGRRRSYGIELYAEQKQVRDFFGTLSVSLSRTQDRDPRIPPLVRWYASDYDYSVIVTALAGQVVRGVRDWLDDLPFFLKYPSYVLPLSNEMEISFKYRYQTGRVYTPVEFVTWKQYREGGLKWSQGAWVATDRVNAERYPDYSRLDLQWISRFYFRSWNINVYVSMQNVLNTKNVFFQNYRSDGTTETVYQFAFFPVVGVEVEF